MWHLNDRHTRATQLMQPSWYQETGQSHIPSLQPESCWCMHTLARLVVLHKKGAMPMQVVLGVLGCPNLPQQPIQEEDGAAGVAERVGTEGIGCLFTAITGQGAFVGPLNGKSAKYQGHTDVNRSMVTAATLCCACSSSASLCQTVCNTSKLTKGNRGTLCWACSIAASFLCSMVCNTSKLTKGKGRGVVYWHSKGPL